MFTKWFLRRQLQSLQTSAEGRFTIPDTEALVTLGGLRQIVFPTSHLFYAGAPVLRQFFAVEDQTEVTKNHVLQLAASLAAETGESLFQPIARAAREMQQPVREIEVDHIAETGVLGKLDRTWYILGDESCLQQEQQELGMAVARMVRQFESEGMYTLFLAQKQPKRLLGIFACQFPIRPEAPNEVTALHELGLEVVILTETRTAIARSLGRQLGVTLVHSELKSSEKAKVLQSLMMQQPATAIIEQSMDVLGGITLSVNGRLVLQANDLQTMVLALSASAELTRRLQPRL